MKKTLNLKVKSTISFPIKDFSIEKSFYNPGHFNSNIDHYNPEKNVFYTNGRYKDKLLGFKFYCADTGLNVDIFTEAALKNYELEEIKNAVKIIDMNTKFAELYSDDEFVKNVNIKNKGKYRVSGFTPYLLYQNLIISTFLQNATVQRTVTMSKNMLDNYGTKINFGNIELLCFWTPENLKATEEDMRALKLGYRAKNILRITDFFVNSKLTDDQLHALPTDKLEKELLKIFGVGKQTVFYLLDGYFGRTEYLKHIPPWERKILSQYLFEEEMFDEKYLIKWFKDRYSNWCGYALNEIFIDIFYQHKEKPFEWLSKIQREK